MLIPEFLVHQVMGGVRIDPDGERFSINFVFKSSHTGYNRHVVGFIEFAVCD